MWAEMAVDKHSTIHGKVASENTFAEFFRMYSQFQPSGPLVSIITG